MIHYDYDYDTLWLWLWYIMIMIMIHYVSMILFVEWLLGKSFFPRHNPSTSLLHLHQNSCHHPPLARSQGWVSPFGDRWHVTGDRWQVTGDRCQVTGDRGQVTGDRWQVTGDRFPFSFKTVEFLADVFSCNPLALDKINHT